MADMRFRMTILSSVLFILAGVGLARGGESEGTEDWRSLLRKRLPLYGHRNWIVVADSAYPAQARPGVETIVSGGGQTEVLREVLARIGESKHVRPIVYLDRELAAVPERDAPGVEAYRKELLTILPKADRHEMLHEEIIGQLDKAGETFRVLIIKTNMTIPYTSVFLQLDCGYWSAESESRLRNALGGQK